MNQAIPVDGEKNVEDDKKQLDKLKDKNEAALPPPVSNEIQFPAVINKAKEVSLSPIEKMNFSSVLTAPMARSSFFSRVVMEQSTFTHDVYFRLDYGAPFDTSSLRAFRLSRKELIQKMIGEWSTYFDSIPQSEEEMFKLAMATSPEAQGFNVISAVRSLMHPNRNRTARTFLRDIRDESLDPNAALKRYRKKAFVAATASERELMVTSDQITRRRFGRVRELWDFMATFRDMFVSIAPLGIVDDHLVKFYRPDEQRALTEFLTKNFAASPSYVDVFSHIVRTRLNVNMIPTDLAIKTLLQVVAARMNSFSAVSDYPSKVKSNDGSEFMIAVVSAILLKGFTRIGVQISFEDASISMLLQCIMIKLYVPLDAMDAGYAMDVDNYLARWLIPAIPGYDATRVAFDQRVAEARGMNYLSRMQRDGSIANFQRAQQIWDYLLTSPNGRGWANAGQRTIVNLPASAATLLNRNVEWYEVPWGAPMRDRADAPTQWRLFEAFVDAVAGTQRINIAGPHQRLGEALQRLLQYARVHRAQILDAMWYIQRFVRSHTLNSLYIPYNRQELVAGQYDVMMVPAGGAYSATILFNTDGRTEIQMPIDLVHFGWRVNEDFNSFVAAWHMADAAMSGDDYFGRNDRLRDAFAHSTDSTGFMSVLKSHLLDNREFVSMNMPDATFLTRQFVDRRAMIERFIDDNKVGFHLADELIYKFNPPAIATGAFARVLDYSPAVDPAPLVLSYVQLQDLIAAEQYASILAAARQAGRTVIIRMPTQFTIKKIDQWDLPHTNPVRIPTSNTYLGVDTVPHYYTCADVIIDDTRADSADRSYPSWGVDVEPFVSTDEAFIRSLFGQIEVDKDPLKFVTNVTFTVHQ